MSNAMNIVGHLSNLEIDAEGKVSNVEGQISEVQLQNGEKITILGAIKKIMRESRTTTASAFKVEAPGKPAEFISSADSPKLFNNDGTERELPAGATVKQEYQAKAGDGSEVSEKILEAVETGPSSGEVEPESETASEVEDEAEAEQD